PSPTPRSPSSASASGRPRSAGTRCCRRPRTSRPWRWLRGCWSRAWSTSLRFSPSTSSATGCATPPTRIAIEIAVTTETQPPLTVRDLRVSFALDEGLVRAVDGTSFDVMPGQVLGVVGESGCGKSVTMRAILQLVERPGRITSGEIHFRRRDGSGAVDLARLPPRGPEMRDIRGGEIALIPQEPMAAFSPVHRVGDKIIEGLMLHGHRWQTDRKLSRGEARDITVRL